MRALIVVVLGPFAVIPAEARTVRFSGADWTVKGGSALGPGPNDWSATVQNVWVDAAGRLHLRAARRGEVWVCAEVYTAGPARPGRHRLRVFGESLDRNAVFGAFLYKSDSEELDFEWSRWGIAGGLDAQFAVQPFAAPGNLRRFRLPRPGAPFTVELDWRPEGTGFALEQEGVRQAWRHGAGAALEGARFHLNLWFYQGRAPSDGQPVEVVVEAAELP